MTESVETVDEQGMVDDLMKTMTERRIRHVPVVTNGRLTGSSASATS
jgi:CBS domain-containing protein